MKHTGTIGLRWMIHRDLKSVVAIERASALDPWTEQDFLRCLKAMNCIGIVAETERGSKYGAVVGFLIYEGRAGRFHLLNMGVHPRHRRRGVGRQLVLRIKSRLQAGDKQKVVCEVAESNLNMQLFLRALGFKATRVIRGGCGTEDAYRMAYKLGEE